MQSLDARQRLSQNDGEQGEGRLCAINDDPCVCWSEQKRVSSNLLRIYNPTYISSQDTDCTRWCVVQVKRQH